MEAIPADAPGGRCDLRGGDDYRGGVELKMKKGDKVRYISCIDAQVKWGNCDDPRGLLTPGSEYIISKVEEHDWHTKISLRGFKGRFQSTCFELVFPEEAPDA